ncbi:MAG: hypothetical protein B6D41_12290 [Chloroflexi bacterium UTCFX4]|jgi:hypothetical protein|nr:MAG: hypothetical protein B6D41_12290 [Chloroflexi bacterium UTCFX4]
MRSKENAALRNAAQKRVETARGQRLSVSARKYRPTPRASQILTPMLRTAHRKRWTRVLDALLELAAKWTQSV